jgi:hypothetical protein
MGRFRFDSLTTDGRLEMIRQADAVCVLASNEIEIEEWVWNKGVPRAGKPGSPAHTINVLELTVESREQFSEAQSLVLQVKEGVGAGV